MRIPLKYLLFLVFITAYYSLTAQSAANPFELKYREAVHSANPFDLTKSIQENKDTGLQKENIAQKKIANPFDLLKSPPESAKTNRIAFPKMATKQINSSKNPNFLFWFLLFVLLFFTTIVSLSRKRLKQVYSAFLNDNMLRQIHRSHGGISFSYWLLYLLFFSNLGLLIFLSTKEFGYELPQRFTFLLLLILSVALVFLLRHLLLFLVGKIFPIEKEIRLYSFTIMIFGIILGIFLLPLNILVAYAPSQIATTSVYVALGAIFVIYVFRSLRGLAIGSRYAIFHKFHFLLYLCAVEILPVIVLLKIILLRIS